MYSKSLLICGLSFIAGYILTFNRYNYVCRGINSQILNYYSMYNEKHNVPLGILNNIPLLI